jgi:GAF domain-containing protein
MKEIRSPNFAGEITLMIMRYASEVVDRGVFFVLKSGGISGMGQFGLGEHGPAADERVRQIRIPLDQPSVLTEVLDKRQTYLGPLAKSDWNDRLMEHLGNRTPQTVVAVPMTVNDTVVAILYGDNALSGRPVGEIEGLELLMNQAGLAMEKALLELKIKNIENKTAAAAPPKR